MDFTKYRLYKKNFGAKLIFDEIDTMLADMCSKQLYDNTLLLISESYKLF